MFYCRARIFPQKAATEGSARGIALSRPTKTAPSAIPNKSRAVFVACERSEVLTARKCRALQSHAAFWEMRHKSVKHRSNGQYPGTGGMAPTRSALSRTGGKPVGGPRCESALRVGGLRAKQVAQTPTANGIRHVGGCGASVKSRRESKKTRGTPNPGDRRIPGKLQNPAATLSAAARQRRESPYLSTTYW
jgi:hypothetical protein